MENRFASWPKVELHRHIEGCMRVETFCDLANMFQVELPAATLEEARKLIELDDRETGTFDGFLRTFYWLRRVIASREALTRVTYEAIEDAAKENVVYLELRFNPGAMFMYGMNEEDVAAGICEAVEQGKREFGLHAGIIGIVGRDMKDDLAERSTKFCIDYFGRGIDAMDLAGSETVPPDIFVPHFRRAADAGLPITIHAGEIAGADNIITSIRMLGAQRIGHGTRLFQSQEAVQCVLDHGVAIETCLTSNYYTGAVSRLEDHPMPRMLQAGIPVSINADDPSVIHCLKLEEEYRVASEVLGLDDTTIKKIIKNSVEHGFLKDEVAVARGKLAALGV